MLGDIYDSIPSSEGDLTPHDRTIAALERSLTISKEIQNRALQSKILSRLSWKYRKKDFEFAKNSAIHAFKLSKSSGNKYAETKALKAMAVIYRRYGKYKTSSNYELKALELARRTGDIFSQSTGLNDIGFDYSRYVNLTNDAQHSLEESIAIKNRIGSNKTASLSNLAWIFARQGEWKQAESYWRKAVTESSERGQSLYQYNIGRLYTIQEKYIEAETKFIHRISILEKYSSPDELVFLMTAQNYAKLGDIIACQKLLENANKLFKKITTPMTKSHYLYEQAETYRILHEYELAKTACERSLTLLLTNAEDPENFRSIAIARLVMGKILVDIKNYHESVEYLDKAKTAFAIGKHYTLGETMLYLGKAYSGIGDQLQAKSLITEALSEFQRLELFKKEKEAREILRNLMD